MTEEIDFAPIRDLIDGAASLQHRFPGASVELTIPIELMGEALAYAKEKGVKVIFKDLAEEID